MRKPNPKVHEAQRGHLIESARICFARDGFAGTSTEAVRLAAATSSGKLFHYFPTKRALILAVVSDQNRRTQSWLDTLAVIRDPQKAVEILLSDILATAADRVECGLILEIAAEASRDEEVAQLAAEGDRALASLILRLAEAMSSRLRISAGALADFLMILIDGVFSRAGSDPEFRPAAMAPLIREILGHLISQGQSDV